MYEAARLHDEISHTSALGGFLVGAALGIALVAAVAITTFTCGFGAALLAGILAGLGGSLLTAAGEAMGSLFSSPAGVITTASPNVFINGRPAAFVEGSLGACDKHAGPVKVAEGSTNVFINGKPAARKGDKLTCGATISSGSGNVVIGGGTYRYLPVDDEVPQWLRTTVGALMAVAGVAGGIAQVLKIGTQAGLKAALPCALKFTAGFVMGEVASRAVVGPAINRVAAALTGNPVDGTTGRKLLLDTHETDFSLPGLMPIEWARFYASDLTVDSVLGQGWVLPWEQSLRCTGKRLYLTDTQGRSVPFVSLQPGERIYNPHEQLYLVRSQGGHYLLQTLDNLFFYFGEIPEDNTPVPLQRIENAHGHFLHFTRTAEGQLTDITATGGTRVHLHYDHPLGRLTEVKRIVGDRAVETLVTYRYDPNGQLSQVVNRNGDTTRYFSYTDGVMTRHSNALGLACEYRWQTLDGQPRVVEHWTSDGEHYHYTYDFQAGITQVTDALNRQARFEFNKDHRVTASQDFGGEHYRFELDEHGNMTGLTLPDGNRIALQYDALGRLTEETDPLGRTFRYQYHQDTTQITQVSYPDGATWKARYDDKGTLLAEYDALGQRTEYFHGEDGLPHTVVDATEKSKHLWWNALGQLERFQDCSGKVTTYRYDERHHLAAVTDALGNTTEFERQPAGEILRIRHPDGTQDAFTYNPLGQVLTHTNGKGHSTRLLRNERGLPRLRTDAKGGLLHYEYDKALRLTALVNENFKRYDFHYDASDRLIEEVRVDNLIRRFSYDSGGHLTRLQEIGYGEQGEQPQRITEFERDPIGRLTAKVNGDARHDYAYDIADRLLKIQRTPTDSGRKLGVSAETLEFKYDPLGRLIKETTPQGALGYDYDPLHNLAALTLSDGRQLNHLYYGSGHLHQLNLDGQVICDIERDDLHREIYRTQGALTSRFGYDAMGRRAWQYASFVDAKKLSSLHSPQFPPTFLLDDSRSPTERRYSYDPAGELARTLDKLRGEITYEYAPNGQLLTRNTGRFIDSEHFRYDPAANRLDQGARKLDKVADNRLKKLDNQAFDYDPWGNLVTKRTGPFGIDVQTFEYDSENRLVHTQHWKEGKRVSEGWYQYDSLGRRIRKKALTPDSPTPSEKTFQWQGLRLLKEQTPQGQRLYVYEPDSYAPLARVDNLEGQDQKTYYFHTDPIGIPLEMTDAEGRIVWQATFKAWGGLDSLEVDKVEQNLRFQGQYFDLESGLHYNTFRYYDPGVGRFITQDPIGLLGGNNLYQYAPSPVGWVDPLGWVCGPNKKTSYEGVSRRDAFRQAKRDAGIEQTQHPTVRREVLEDGYGKAVLARGGARIQTRQYHYINRDGKEIIIQEHSMGHVKATPLNGAEPHFNVRPVENPRTGHVSKTNGHYNFPGIKR
ncbi:RHS repeat-associated core domain-containing protein [Pseudomonas massiliensis]|uniref:RHS repeat-associated core domain-containing protein n=1 Tax=Pseudomonas massiliensis TaxID=522492 RepID=UPI000A01C779|nr:RHS repeat-associated core domain-containing protein [Pseudomonas massiliensis]